MRTIAVPVEGADQVGEARRAAAVMAAGLGFSDSDSARAALAATECATNLWKHAGGGEILLSANSGAAASLEILALDRGPGMTDPARCFRDGYSTAGSPGTGLGAVERASSHCEVFTVEGHGTALLARVGKARGWDAPPRPAALECGCVSVPLRGETACGDACSVKEFPGFALVMVVDGLGHGLPAAECAMAAQRALEESGETEPVELIYEIHAALRSTRGAAVTVARLDLELRRMRVAGVGNVAGFVYHDGAVRHLTTQPGIVGHEMRNVKEFTYDWAPDSLVLLYSDGISSHWSLDTYNGLTARDTSLIAGVIYRDWKRGRDDATVLVIRQKPSV